MNKPTIHRQFCSSTKNCEDDHNKEKHKDLSEMYNIFKEIYLRAPENIKKLFNSNIDNKECEKYPIDLKKVNEKFQNKEYMSVMDVMKDIRLVFLNCYEENLKPQKKSEVKELKSLSEGINKEVVREKRVRKSVVKLGVNYDSKNVKFDSDEYQSESEEYPSDLTDSEDEWGYQLIKKNKLSLQTSLLAELEKRVERENKSSNKRKNRANNIENQLSENKKKTLHNKQKKTNDSCRYKSIQESTIPKQSPDISVQPVNLHQPKDKETTLVKQPQTTIRPTSESSKKSTAEPNGQLKNKVEKYPCKMITKHANGEVEFFVIDPNVKLNQSSNDIVNRQASTVLKQTPNISIKPVNLPEPKDIETTLVKQPQGIIPSTSEPSKRLTAESNGQLKNKVKKYPCKMITKNYKTGEVEFFVIDPSGKLNQLSNTIVNRYLKEHNNELPDYWMI